MASLELIAGPFTGVWYPLTGTETLIGREGFCQIVLPHKRVSRHHARIRTLESGFQLFDEGSTNGTYVNQRRVVVPCMLREGDQIQVAQFTLVFHTADVPNEPTRPEVNAVFEHAAEHAHDPRTVLLKAPISGLQLQCLPDRLRAVTEITRSLTSHLNVDGVLPHVLNVLFGSFPQLINGQILLRDEHGALLPRALREGRDDDSAVFPMAPIENQTAACVFQTGEMVIQESLVSESVLEEEPRLTIALPVVGPSRQTLGVIYLEMQCARSALADEELEVLSIVSHTTGLAVELAQTHQRILTADRLDQSLQFAREVQLAMLPVSAPPLPGYQISAHYQAAQQVGGDFYCYLPLPGDRLMIAMGDIVGKGVPAALTMAQFVSEVRHAFANAVSLKRAMYLLNQAVVTQVHKFLTLVVCVLNPRTHQIVVVNAGHPPPLCLRQSDHRVVPLQPAKAGLPLGVLNQTEYHPEAFDLNPSDQVLLFTDGLTDTINLRKDLYGSQRLRAVLGSCARLTPSQTLHRIITEVNDFRGPAEQSDDTCLLCLQRER